MLIRDMAAVERPRERLLRLGVDALKEEELLALVLRTGIAGADALEIAYRALHEHPLSRLAGLPLRELQRLRGFGVSKAASLLAALELGRRLQPQHPELPKLQSVQDIAVRAADIRDKKKEYLMAFFLNARHQLIEQEVVSIGTLTASLAHPREIFAPAIGKAAAGVVLVHNHPSGDPSPSDEDVRLTQRIAHAGRILGIDLVDHVIVATRGVYSFRTAGRI